LNGLAVRDIYGIHRNAEKLSIVGRARLILKTEASLRALQRCITCSVKGTNKCAHYIQIEGIKLDHLIFDFG